MPEQDFGRLGGLLIFLCMRCRIRGLSERRGSGAWSLSNSRPRSQYYFLVVYFLCCVCVGDNVKYCLVHCASVRFVLLLRVIRAKVGVWSRKGSVFPLGCYVIFSARCHPQSGFGYCDATVYYRRGGRVYLIVVFLSLVS